MRIGIDFDNTIITYDNIFLAAAKERGLVDENFCGRKQAIRDAIRLLPDGELSWQRLQGQVYGKGIGGAAMFAQAASFLRRCHFEQYPVLIVSHKTKYGHHDPDRIDLHQAALGWMKVQGFFSDHYGIRLENVFFEDTRDDKIARIAALGCTHFIDDLEEVLTDPAFPPNVTRILFSDYKTTTAAAPYVVCSSWRHIEEYVFRERG
jgi:hypothetical protein